MADEPESYWRPQVMRHRRRDGAVEYAMHDVYLERGGRVGGYTEHARSPRMPSPAALKAWIIEHLPAAAAGVVCGDLGYTHRDYDLELWLEHVDDPPLDYE
jgi:hypothetical protein